MRYVSGAITLLCNYRITLIQWVHMFICSYKLRVATKPTPSQLTDLHPAESLLERAAEGVLLLLREAHEDIPQAEGVLYSTSMLVLWLRVVLVIM